MRISPCVFNTIFSKSWASIPHYPVAEASLKKVIHDCFVEQDNPFPSNSDTQVWLCLQGLTPSITWPNPDAPANLKVIWDTVSCHRGLGEQTCSPSSLARCRCCWRSCAKWLPWPREKKFQTRQFSSYPGESLWVFRDTWKITQEQVLVPGTDCGNAVLSTARPEINTVT